MVRESVKADRDSRHRVALGVALSVTLHLMVFALLAAQPVEATHPEQTMDRPELEPPDEPEREVRLGNPDSRVTSFTWIGQDEYVEQYSPVESPIDQAQLTTNPRAPLPTPSPAREVVTRVEPSAAAPARSLVEAPTTAEADAPTQTETALDEVLSSIEQPEIDLPGEIPVEESLGDGPPPSPQEQPKETTLSEKELAEAVPLQRQSSAGGGDPGELADRESPFSARMTRDELQRGKPLAGHGLYIRTLRPRASMFSHVTRMLRSPRNPLFRIHFRADGTVDHVDIVESSGVRDIDRPMLDLLYRWTAEGPQLDSLGRGRSDETISVEIRILFRR